MASRGNCRNNVYQELAMAELIQELTGCTLLEAQEALDKFHGNVVDAVESLVVKPRVRGDDYMPSQPNIDTGLTPEQEELCRRGRDLQDKVNAVFSVAHSQTQRASSLSHEAPQEQTVVVSEALTHPEVSTLMNEPQQDSSA